MTGLLKKAGLGIALAATAMTAAAPANAQYYGYRHYHHGGGDAAAGAILGGIVGLGVGAAIASSNHGYDRDYYDRGYYNRGYYNDGYNYNYNYNSYYSQPQAYYYNDYRRCWVERRYDPYYDRSVRVRVCN